VTSGDAAATDGSHYDGDYYAGNGQDGDRPALRWYTRLVRRYCGSGPYLDFGCGTGHLLRRLSALGPAAGFEVSSWSATKARATAGCQVYEHLDDIPTEGFSVVVAVHVLEHLDDVTAATALAGWRRVLRPGGHALVVMPDPAGRGRALSGPDWVGYDDPTHINLKPHAQWNEFLVAHGFDVLRQGSDGLWNVPYSRLPRLVDAARFAVPSLTQFLAGRLFLPPGSGESSVFVLRRRA
jgi:SAM-dependent methyltransferase